MELEKMLVTLCKQKGFSLAKLAKASGVPKATIHGWTTGRSALNLDQLRRVAQVLEVSLYRLVFGENDPFDSPADEVLKEIFTGDVRVTLHKIERKRHP